MNDINVFLSRYLLKSIGWLSFDNVRISKDLSWSDSHGLHSIRDWVCRFARHLNLDRQSDCTEAW